MTNKFDFEEYIKDLSPELQEKARPKMSFYSLRPMKIWKYLWTHLKAWQAAAMFSAAYTAQNAAAKN